MTFIATSLNKPLERDKFLKYTHETLIPNCSKLHPYLFKIRKEKKEEERSAKCKEI